MRLRFGSSFVPVVVGCAAAGLIGVGLVARPAPKPSPAPETTLKVPERPTYAEHIAPLLNQACVSCHRPGEAAPFSLVGYENAKRWSSMIVLATETGRMPPWKAQPADVEYLNDAHLSTEHKAMLKNWHEAGAPRGDKAKEPKTPEFPVGWRLGKPDMIWEMPYEKELSSEGSDEYWNFVITPDIKEPTWISAIDVKAGNPEIVHHVIVYLDKKGRAKKLVQGDRGDGKSGYTSSGGGVGFMPDGALGGWAPGAKPERLPEESAFLVEPGTDIVLQIHYNKSGKVEKDRTQVAVYTNKGEPSREVEIAWIANPFINIEPGKANQKFNWQMGIPRPIRLYSLMPHMHYLGKSMVAHAELPDGKKMKLIDVQDWDFNWQLIYGLKNPLVLPAGSKITLEATYDNSTDNPFNPSNPPKRVRWGEETEDEMMLLVATYSLEK